uniref:Poly [ADP-ribose] polymerase n=1 Tax=Meloidogyne incognita TaxID=6306 RepID=A0A914LP61_MELIC
MAENNAKRTSGEGESQLESKEAPYGAEYAKSGRATCKGCKEPIEKGALRMSVRFQSKFFDGFQDNWHHFECFWKKARKNDINEVSIRGLDWLKWEDQELIRQRINELAASGDSGYTPKTATIKVEHAKSGTGKCFSCKEKIPKDELRISGRSSFYHVDCFHTANSDHKLFQKSAEEIVGYNQLEANEKSKLEKLFPKPQSTGQKREFDNSATTSGTSNETPVMKKGKLENDELKAALKNQSDVLWKLREELKKHLNHEEMEELLVANKSYKSKKGGPERMLDKLVDMIAFGPAQPCPQCNKTLTYYTDIHAYRCSGSVTEYTRCLYTTKKPGRTQFRIPSEMKKENKYLKKLKSPLLTERVYPAAAFEEKPVSGSKAFGYLNYARNEQAKSKVSENNNQKMVVKGGYVVDPRCDVAETTHVYVDPITKHPWQVNLSAVDITTGKNSFYKLQIVKDDKGSTFHLFRAWGRVGTTIGGVKTEDYGEDLEACQKEFKFQFHDKCFNTWEDYVEGNFKKAPAGMDILEMDEQKNDEKKTRKLSVESSKSKLPREIKELISLVFDVKAMQNAMMEFEIDLEKMPLGRLSKNHILKAYKVLKDLQFALEKPEGPSKNEVLDFTNRFYTLIPHALGFGPPPFIDSHEILISKTSMLDSLLDIEIAYNILKTDQNEIEENGTKDIFDLHYSKLNCCMEVLDKKSEEFGLINRYLANTHASTHTIKLEIINVLKIQRLMEVKNFKKEMGNRYLLWHGSRLTNYAGILSQGLRIAPPEAPVTGYMFGKGIYFADMVTKSANYCYAMSGEGLLLLCDVALGEIQEEVDAKDLKKPKRGKNSVKGIGGTFPNPKENVQFDEMTIPCGKPINSEKKKLSLLYNEYIVYDESQVQLRYIVRVKFDSGNLL